MKEYYFNGKNIEFYPKVSGRSKVTRKRFSYLYSSEARKNLHLPFRVENYFGPAFFYTGLMNHRRKYECGVDVIRRGIYRNKMFKGEY